MRVVGAVMFAFGMPFTGEISLLYRDYKILNNSIEKLQDDLKNLETEKSKILTSQNSDSGITNSNSKKCGSGLVSLTYGSIKFL